MFDIRRPPAWFIGSAAALFLTAVVFVVLSLPSVVLPTAAWHDGGLRLFRDDHETGIYFERSRWVGEGAFPYTQGHEQEYPPAAVLYFALPRLLSQDHAGYQLAFLLMNAALFGLLVGLTAALLKKLSRPIRLVWLLFLPASLYFSVWRFEILPAVLVAAFLLASIEERTAASLILLAVAVLTKYYPALFFIPLFIMVGSRRWGEAALSRLRRGMLAVAAILAAVVVVQTVTAGFETIISPIMFHLSRDFEVGSLGALLLWLPVLNGFDPRPLGRILLILFTALQLAPPVFLLLRCRLSDHRSFIRACLFLLLPFILFNRFFSPQWVLWITPVYLLVASPRETVVLAAMDVLLFFQFPVFFGVDPYGWPYFFVCLARTAAIIYFLAANWLVMSRSGALRSKKLLRAPAIVVPPPAVP